MPLLNLTFSDHTYVKFLCLIKFGDLPTVISVYQERKDVQFKLLSLSVCLM